MIATSKAALQQQGPTEPRAFAETAPHGKQKLGDAAPTHNRAQDFNKKGSRSRP